MMPLICVEITDEQERVLRSAMRLLGEPDWIVKDAYGTYVVNVDFLDRIGLTYKRVYLYDYRRESHASSML